MNLSRKRKKELRQLQNDAERLWQSQQVIVGNAADIAREAGRQLGNFNREQVMPAVHDSYERHVAPTVDRGLKVGKKVVDQRVVPVIGGVVGTALTAWDVANQKRESFSNARHGVVAKKKGMGVGSVIALVLGAAAAVGVVVAAWQALRADDELWVADDPLSPPNV